MTKYQSSLQKIYFLLQITAYHEEESGQELKNGTRRQKLRQKLWSARILVCSSWFARVDFLHTPGPLVHKCHRPHGLAFSYKSPTEKMPPREGIFFSVEVLELTKQTKRKANHSAGPQITSPDACFYEQM